jgi:hypothetical protein
MKTTLDIVAIASTGVNIVVDASAKTTMDLMVIINAVVKSGGHILLKNCDRKTTFDLLSICKNNPRNITIDLT